VRITTNQGADVNDLELLLEERAIMRALHEYAHNMDYGHEDAWVGVFTDDAVFDVVEVVGGRRVHREDGRGELAQYVANYPKPPHFRKHVVVDPIIDITDDTAKVAAYWLLLQRNDDTGSPVLVAFGHYDDQWVKRDGRWRIAHRYAEVEATTY
jgi:hypothetical protein